MQEVANICYVSLLLIPQCQNYSSIITLSSHVTWMDFLESLSTQYLIRENIFDLLVPALKFKTVFILLPQFHKFKITSWGFICFNQLKSYTISVVSGSSSILPSVMNFQLPAFFPGDSLTWFQFLLLCPSSMVLTLQRRGLILICVKL